MSYILHSLYWWLHNTIIWRFFTKDWFFKYISKKVTKQPVIQERAGYFELLTYMDGGGKSICPTKWMLSVGFILLVLALSVGNCWLMLSGLSRSKSPKGPKITGTFIWYNIKGKHIFLKFVLFFLHRCNLFCWLQCIIFLWYVFLTVCICIM